MREALFECFSAITRLVRHDWRRQLILVGGAASTAHSSRLWTEDVDVAAPSALSIYLLKVVKDGAQGFSSGPDDKIVFDASQGFRVYVDIIEIGMGCIDRIHVAEPFSKGSVASKSDLLMLRAVTVIDRGEDGDIADFRWLLSEVAKAGQVLPGLDQEELEVMTQAGASCLGVLDRLVFYVVIGINI